MQGQASEISLLSYKTDGFENPPVKIDGFGRTHRTHADGAPVDATIRKTFRQLLVK